MKDKPILLIPIQWYHPGFRAGGITQAVRRLAEGLADYYQIFILTTNRDHGSTTPYLNIESNVWICNEGVQVKYLSKTRSNCQQFNYEIESLQPDIIYIKSMFNPLFSLYPLWLKYKGATNAKVVLAPSGMLKSSALSHKAWKKKPALMLIRKMGILSNLEWHATDIQEREDIKNQIGLKVNITLLPEFPPILNERSTTLKKCSPLKLLFISRIHPIKNLSFLLQVLFEVKAPIALTIAGPVEDTKYLLICQSLVNRLPPHIVVRNIGELPQSEVQKHFQNHHAFVLPSKGEAFGNVILEALSNGCPVVISDQTPWKNLQSSLAGWDLPLCKSKDFVKAIESLALMDQATYDNYCKGALDYARKAINLNELVREYKNLFIT